MFFFNRRHIFEVAFILLCGCGGTTNSTTERVAASDPYSLKTKDATAHNMSLADAEFTTAVDKTKLISVAPVSTEFLPDTKQIYFLGELTGLPAESEIEVRWSKSTQGEPFHITQSIGRGDFTVLSRLMVERDNLEEGEYWAIVAVNGSEVGKHSFRIVGRRSGGMMRVKQLKVGLGVTSENDLVSSSNSLPKGIKKICASFFVGGVETGNTIRMKWYRDTDNLIEETDIECEGEKKYSACFENKKAFSIGNYGLEIEVEGEVFARRNFYVGDTSGRPVIDQAALGTKLGKNQIPKTAKTTFKAGVKTIKCGIQFAFIPDNATVEVAWISEMDGKEETLHVSKINLKKGGTSAVGLGWKPGKKMSRGPYRASILVNSVKYKEISFTIQ